jgi:hypothetical protein
MSKAKANAGKTKLSKCRISSQTVMGQGNKDKASRHHMGA